ncbi:MAG: hypothetical protein LBR80_04615 [Deltaproteobacteria bacterium]|nr:hypothetical protein [Deltaproteobacteria bacterium]
MGYKVFPPWRDGPPLPGLYRAANVIANRYPLHVYVDKNGTSWYCFREFFRGYEFSSIPFRTPRIRVKVPGSGKGGTTWRTFVTQETLTGLAARSRGGEVKAQREWTALMLETGGFAPREADLVLVKPEVRRQ